MEKEPKFKIESQKEPEETKVFKNPLDELRVFIERGKKPKGPPPEPPKQPKEKEPDYEYEKPPEEEEEEEEDEEQEQEKEGPIVIDPWQPPIENPSPINRKTIEDFIEFQKEKEAEEEAKEEEEKKARRLTPKERAQKVRKNEDERFIREFFESEGEKEIAKMLKVAEEYRQLEESVEPYVKDLAQVFEQVMQNVSQQVSLAWEEGWRSGRFNIERFIKKYGAYLQEGAPPLQFSEIDVYDQKEFFERLRLFPEKIKVRLVLDGSGSMDEERLLALKQNAILIMEALSAFEFTINLRFSLKEPIHIDTEIRMFGSQGRGRIIKPFAETKNYNPEEARADRLKAFPFIHNNYGGTCDAEPWWKIDASLDDPKYLEELKSNKAKEFIFEVTDGGSNESTHPKVLPAQDTRDAIDAVEKKGGIARGFQIGTPTDEEKAVFDQIWGKNGSRIDHPKKLVPAIAKTLAEEIQKAQFKIQYEEGEE